MQSSLLGLALANKFFEDPVVGVPPAISVSQVFVSQKIGLPCVVFHFRFLLYLFLVVPP